MKYFIKNMVCNRCKMVVESAFKDAGLHTVAVELGEVETKDDPSAAAMIILTDRLTALGFEMIDTKKGRLIEQIKNAIVTLIHYGTEQPSVNLSDFLSKKLHYDYNYLSNLFSGVEGISIEKYLIAQKIEKVKELLKYDELSLSQIADQLGYSSVAYLSNQFKKQTGLTPSYFKKEKYSSRKNLDEL